MPAPGSLVRSFLGEASLRIQRLLDLDALVSPKFDREKEIVPVVIVGDGERPGMGDRRGRRFGIFQTQAAGAACSISCLQTIQVDALVVGCDTAGRITIAHLSAADVAAGAGWVTDGRFLDGNQTEELPPMQRTAGVAGAANFAAVRVAANGSLYIPFPFQLVAGCGLSVQGAGGNTDFTVLGRLF